MKKRKLLSLMLAFSLFLPFFANSVLAQEPEAATEEPKEERIIRVNLFVHQETGTEPTANYSTRPSWDKNLLEKLDFTLTEETTDPDAMPRVYKPELVGSGDSHQLIANVPAGNYTLTVTDKGLPEGYQLADGEPLYTGSGYEYINSTKSVHVDVPADEKDLIVTFYTLVAHERYITNTFDPNGGVFADGSEDMKTDKVKLLTNGVTLYKNDKFTPTREGYVFKGWLNEDNGKISPADTQFGAKSAYAGETFAYKAVWEKEVEETEETTAPESTTTEKPVATTTEKPAATTTKPADKVASTGVTSTALVGVATLVSALGAAYVKRRK